MTCHNCSINSYLQKRLKSDWTEITTLKNREAQNLIHWNLVMADKDSSIASLTDQIDQINQGLSLEQEELDMLANSEGGLLELSKDISITSQQVKVG